MSDEYPTHDEEWEQRQLCSDGNCIGVIGPDGRCKECGKPAEGGTLPKPQGQDESPPEVLSTEAGTEEAAPAEETPAEEDVESADDDWANRRLCPDGNCIGVIGPDGKCKECGRLAE